MTTAPDGLYEYGGAPVGSGRYSSPWAKHWFVDGVDGSAGNSGTRADDAFIAVQAAITASGVGDVIYIRPKTYIVGTGQGRYDEALTVGLTQSDLSIIGVRNFNNTEFGVRLYEADASYVMTSSAPGLHLENLAFFANTSSYGSLILQNNAGTNTQRNDGCTIYNCNFKGGTTGKGVMIQGGQATRVINSVFNHAAAGKLTIAVSTVSGYNQQVRGCVFLSNSGTAPVQCQVEAGGGNVYSLLIEGCLFNHAIPSTETYYINIPGAQSTGLIANCMFENDDITASTSASDIIKVAAVKIANCHDDSGALIAST